LKTILRFPRLELKHALKDIPRFDPSKVKKNKMLIEDFVVEGTTQVSCGKFGTRKTSIHLLAGWCISQGIPFLGRKTERRMVLYLDYENPPGVLKSYCQDLGIDPVDPWFTIWDRASVLPPQPAEAPHDPIEKFIHRCRRATGHGPCIIFDSFTSLLRAGESGNDSNHAARIYRNTRRYCDLGATCTIIDHTGKKGGKEPIGTSAKMTQMDTAHFFSVHEKTMSLDGRSFSCVIRVENFLKRFAPEGVGTFSMQVKATNASGEWHTTGIEPTKDISVRKVEKKVRWLQELITENPKAGQNELGKLAATRRENGSKLLGEKQAIQLLKEGAGRYWKVFEKGKDNKKVFRLIEANRSKS
jgi:hypothetical protein